MQTSFPHTEDLSMFRIGVKSFSKFGKLLNIPFPFKEVRRDALHMLRPLFSEKTMLNSSTMCIGSFPHTEKVQSILKISASMLCTSPHNLCVEQLSMCSEGFVEQGLHM